jgi:hypothetical protein
VYWTRLIVGAAACAPTADGPRPGACSVSSLPIILHPVIAFGMLSGMSNGTILTIVMAGRTIKYIVMAYVTANAPGALRFFGIKGQLVEYATQATAAKKE